MVRFWGGKTLPLGASRLCKRSRSVRCPDGDLHYVSSQSQAPPSTHILTRFRLRNFWSCRFSYVVDCYPKSAKEVVTIMNLFRVISSFVVLFYNQRLDKAVGYDLAFGIEAIISAMFGLGGLGVLVAVGGKFR